MKNIKNLKFCHRQWQNCRGLINYILLEKIKDIDKRLWYAEECIKNGWSKIVLIHQIELEFTDTEDIFEKIAILFLDNPSELKNKIDNLIKEIGYDYVDIIENDLSILEQLL